MTIEYRFVEVIVKGKIHNFNGINYGASKWVRDRSIKAAATTNKVR